MNPNIKCLCPFGNPSIGIAENCPIHGNKSNAGNSIVNLESIIKSAHEWQLQTFPGATTISKLKHLKDEVKELIEVLEESKSASGGKGNSIHRDIMAEYADCFLLLFGSAYKYGFNMDDIALIISEKMKINKERKLDEPNGDGVVYHKK
jgi:hypothetical protein